MGDNILVTVLVALLILIIAGGSIALLTFLLNVILVHFGLIKISWWIVVVLLVVIRVIVWFIK